MNRINVIKRAGLQSPPEADEKPLPSGSESKIKRQAVVNAVENWIDEWRTSKPRDSRRAFAALFSNPPSVTG